MYVIIFARQLEFKRKHKKFLSRIENINYLFNYSTDEVVQFETMPTIFYLAVDKRNQMHIEEKHMIPVTIEQIFETMKPMYIQKYLANGREYKKEYEIK